MQTLNDHTETVFHIIELKNKKLVSCSSDETIKFYNIDDNNKYKLDYSINTNGFNGPVIQTKDNEICFYENTNSTLCFYDLLERKNITKINNISVSCFLFDSLVMMTKDLLLATGCDKLSIININLHNIIRTIDVSGSSWIHCACMLNENMLLTGDCNKRIIQWKIEGDNLQLISKKENAHEDSVCTLSKIGNGLIISGSRDNFVKIW
jgi:WD40 repeat protein